MTRSTLHTRLFDMRSVGACALRLIIAFTLAFSFTLGAQVAFANAGADADGQQAVAQEDRDGTGTGAGGEGGGAGTSEPSAPSEPSEPSQPSEPSPQPSAFVTKFSIFVDPEVFTPTEPPELAFSGAGVPPDHQQIAIRSGHLKFGAYLTWNDRSRDRATAQHIEWTLDPGNEAIAGIARDTGLLVANGSKNGTVIVTATLRPEYTENGVPLQAQIAVDLTGQEEGPYVESVVICDEAGLAIKPSFTFQDDDLTTAMIELQANVTVFDPRSQVRTAYQVKPGSGLSAQTGGQLADLEWYVMVAELGTVSTDGIYRPLMKGENEVRARGAGKDGVPVEGKAVVIMPGEGEAHPQDSLTIEVAWSAEPDRVVVSKEFSPGDLEALGAKTRSYTALGGSGYGFKSYTGYGPNLVDVLKSAGVDTSSAAMKEASLTTYSYDGSYPISWSLLAQEDRFYFPNYQYGGDMDGAVQVPPMIAINSAYAGAGKSGPVPDDMTDAERFRLLFGARSDGDVTTTNMQRKWINRIRIVMEGPPAPSMADEQNQESDDSEEPDKKERESGIGGGMNTAGGGGDAAGAPTSSGGAGAEGGDENSNPGAWSVLSAVNKNASDIPGLDLENPFGPFTIAASVGMFFAGGVEKFARWRWQKRQPVWA